MREAKVTPSSLFTMSVDDVVRAMTARVLAEIPEGAKNNDDLSKIEGSLGRLANDYAYVISILAYGRNYVRRLKREGADSKELYEDMMDKVKALEDISSAVKLQYQAVSRMLTVRVETMNEREMHEYRKERGSSW